VVADRQALVAAGSQSRCGLATPGLCCTGREFKAGVAGHGWEYCETYLKLVLYIMGREAHDALKASMRKHRVRFREPRKRAPLSPERRAQLVAQLAYARERKAK
jgi:hypothetical protein